MASPVPLLGRDEHLATVRELIEGARDGGGALVLRGEPGIGKSSLLAEARRMAEARGMRVLSTTAVQAEGELAFVGLHQLLEPVLRFSDDIVEPQRHALLAAFGLAEGGSSELFVVALATLNLLTAATRTAPALLVLEDAQWLDRPSADVLAFVARRVADEPIVVLAASRPGFDSPLLDLPVLSVGALDDRAAAALLDRAETDLDAGERRRLLVMAAGNPLALIELPRVWDTCGSEEGELALTARLERAFGDRVRQLPSAAHIVLLAAALDDTVDGRGGLAAAARLVGEAEVASGLVAACGAELVDVDDGAVRFRHPLIRSAVQRTATDAERYRAHAALADALPHELGRRAWHRAASYAGVDEGAAADLERAADVALRSGGAAAAVRALERAAELSADPQARVARLLRAAEIGYELGSRGERALRNAEALALGPAQRAHLLWLRSARDDDVAAAPRRIPALIAAAEAAQRRNENELALRLLSTAAVQGWWTDAPAATRAHLVAVADGLGAAGDPRLLLVLGLAATFERSADVTRWLQGIVADPPPDPLMTGIAGLAATRVDALDLADPLLTAAAEGLRARGQLGALARILIAHGVTAVGLARHGSAVTILDEARRLGEETGQMLVAAFAQAQAAIPAALRGDLDGAERLTAAAERVGAPVNAGFVLATAQHARAVAALADGRPAEAVEQLRRVHDRDDPAHHFAVKIRTVADLAEAAARSDQPETARPIVVELGALPSGTASPRLHAQLRYARAVLAADDVAERAFEIAAGREMKAWPLLRARAQLAYGEWLRRRRHAADSRSHLRAAAEAFDALGVAPWSRRAREELRASGETIRRHQPDARDQLTPQELQIVEMAAEGLTNKQIGQRLYLSHRTVSTHLHRIFPKLGVTSRTQLSGVVRPR